VKVPEVTVLRATNIRKTSISVPSKLNEMDDLRIDRQNVSLIYINKSVRTGNTIIVAVISMRKFLCYNMCHKTKGSIIKIYQRIFDTPYKLM